MACEVIKNIGIPGLGQLKGIFRCKKIQVFRNSQILY